MSSSLFQKIRDKIYANPRKNGDGPFDITDFDITDSDITNLI